VEIAVASITKQSANKAEGVWWSLRPLAVMEPPSNKDAPVDWNQHPIDRFIFQKLKERNLRPSASSDKTRLVRRASYDLTGLPPSPDAASDFVLDESPEAYEKVIDRLLASPAYGERWGRHWLDVIRFGESRGFERNEIIRNAWPFRDYIIRSFNRDKPFDRLIMEHLAGDVIGVDQPDVEIGTTFLVCGPYDDVGNQDPKQAAQIRANTIDEIIRTCGEAFLGLTVGCARCHNHKFDPIQQKDYYSWYATFAGVRHGERVVATTRRKKDFDMAMSPLTEEKSRLEKQRNDLRDSVFKRAEKKADTIEKGYTRPAIDRIQTKETFSPVQVTAVRLVVEGTENNPKATSGYHIDEFEAWTAGTNSTNVAAAAHGGKAEGRSRVPEDFADAYSPDLTIDGVYGARWLAAGSTLTVRFSQPEMIDRVVFSSDRPGATAGNGVAAFVSEYRIEVSSDNQNWKEVANSYDRHSLNDSHRRKRFFD